MGNATNKDRRIEIFSEPDDFYGRSVGIRLWLNGHPTTAMWLTPSEARSLVAALTEVTSA